MVFCLSKRETAGNVPENVGSWKNHDKKGSSDEQA
jgi:hypothetical protein